MILSCWCWPTQLPTCTDQHLSDQLNWNFYRLNGRIIGENKNTLLWIQDSYCTYRALRIFSLLIVFTWGAEGRQSPMAGEILLVDASTSQRILWKFLFPHRPPNPRASWLLSYLSLNMSTMEFLLWFIAGLGLLTFSFLSIDFDFLLHLHCRWIKWQCKSCKLQPAKQKCLILYSNQTLRYKCLAYCPCTNLTHVLKDAMRNVETTHKSAKRSRTIGLGGKSCSPPPHLWVKLNPPW